MPMACPTRAFWQWLGDFGIGFALTFVAAVLLLPLLYAAIRRARESWWLWGAGLAIAFRCSGGGDLAGLHRAFVQSLFAAARRAR